ncbi:phosphomannomutase/phosphoglucomutase [Desulfolutivibrio sp.]|uniref:phosphomannomutase/phosphoglucomutase n=1 Tax=Desulfolutivibrio sp. TaxID=2773296 RepID=UPI002F96AC61
MKDIRAGVFRAYDIRGVVGEDFDPQWVSRLGQAVGTYFRRKGLSCAVVGRDCRESSPEYAARIAAGLLSTGVDVIAVHMVPTPVLYFAVKHLGKRAGVMVTASHNPPQFNGFKIWAGEGTLHTEEITAIFRIMAAGDFANGRGLLSEHDIAPAYLERVTRDIRLTRPVSIVVDGGNGAAGPLAVAALRRAGAEVTPLFCEPDGTFPNHHPDPVVEKNTRQLAAKVRQVGADFGLGLDGDGDRLGVVDEKGTLLFGDRLLALFAREVLAEHPGATVIGEVKCSHLLYKDIAAHGGVSVMGAAGHSLMKEAMRRTGALLAGEMSGHLFFADRYYGFDDATYAALRLAGIVSRSAGPVSEMLADWPQTASTPELRVDCPDAAKFAVVARAMAHFRGTAEIIDVDGVRLVFPDGWALVRASNTQPALVLRFEAETPARLAEIRRLVEAPLAGWIREATG